MFLPNNLFAKKVNWHVIDWAPKMIIGENGKINGQMGELLNHLKTKMKSDEHAMTNMLWSRFWNDVKSNKNICNVMSLKTDARQKYVYYSVPSSLAFSNSIIVRKDSLNRLGLKENTPVSIVDLITNSKIRGLIEKDRSYTSIIDEILQKYKLSSNVKNITSLANSTIAMLLMKRTDYVLEYPDTARYIRSKHKNLEGELVSLPIKEIKNFNYSYVICTKNDWGKRIIEKVNDILIKERPLNYYRQMIEKKARNKVELQMIRSNYEAFLKSN